MYTILVVEDDSSFRQTLAELMKLEGYVVVQASNYEEALELIQGCKPHLVLTDVMLREKSGFDLLQRIKTDDQLSQMIVLLITGLKDQETLARAEQLGADALILKPFEIDDFLSVIKKLLEHL